MKIQNIYFYLKQEIRGKVLFLRFTFYVRDRQDLMEKWKVFCVHDNKMSEKNNNKKKTNKQTLAALRHIMAKPNLVLRCDQQSDQRLCCSLPK